MLYGADNIKEYIMIRHIIDGKRRLRDSDWVPRATYEYMMSKFDACAMENNRLRAKVRRLESMLKDGVKVDINIG